MGLLRRLFGGRPEDGRQAPGGPADEGVGPLEATEATFELHGERHRVTVWLRLTDPALDEPREQLRIFGIEDRIMRALDRSAVGEHDTNALERGFLALRLVGDDADAIVEVVTPLLSDAPAGSYLAVRRGPSGSPEERRDLGPAA